MKQELFNKIISIMSTHDEGDGQCCDTGEDMEWSCRSECLDMATDRLMTAFRNGELEETT